VYRLLQWVTEAQLQTATSIIEIGMQIVVTTLEFSGGGYKSFRYN